MRIWVIESRIAGSKNPKRWLPCTYRGTFDKRETARKAAWVLNEAAQGFEYRAAAYERVEGEPRGS